jgi:hypothetical protein
MWRGQDTQSSAQPQKSGDQCHDHPINNPTPNHLCQLLCWRSVRAGYAGGGDMSDYAELKRLAEAATPGPWWDEKNLHWYQPMTMVVSEKCQVARFVRNEVQYSCTVGKAEREWANAEFIAAANPAAVMALIAERDQLKAENESLRRDAERYRWLRETEVWDDACDEISMKENIWIVESREEVINRTGDDLDRSIDFMIDKK